jgi:DNA repair photolyase
MGTNRRLGAGKLDRRDPPGKEQPGLFDAVQASAGPIPPRSPAPSAGAPGAAGGGPVVREVTCKTLINGTDIADYSFNCYGGCEHACVYCYARFMERFRHHEEPWGGFVDVKINAAEALARQLRRLPAGSVFTCSACDGWQPVEAHYRLTRRCCQMLLDAGFRLHVLTKSELVLRDLGIFAGRAVRLGVTITTPDENQAHMWEPHAASVAARWGVLGRAKEAGLETAVMFGPLLPGISDSPDALRKLMAMAAEARVDHIWTSALNPHSLAWLAVQDLLRRVRPDLEPLYRRVLFDEPFRERYVDELDQTVRQAAAETGPEGRLG